MNKICTSIEQSQKLIDLGIDINTADMRYGYIAPYDFSDRMYEGGYDPTPYHKDFFIKNPMFSTEEYDGELYAWSLSALLSVLPSVITRKGKRMFLTLEKAGAYNLYYKSPDRLDELWETKEDVIDACVTMIENLHELKML